MKYVNAAEILPEKLLRELQTYMDGDVLYIPKASTKRNGEPSADHVHFIRNETGKSKDFIKKAVPWRRYRSDTIWRAVRSEKLYMDKLIITILASCAAGSLFIQ